MQSLKFKTLWSLTYPFRSNHTTEAVRRISGDVANTMTNSGVIDVPSAISTLQDSLTTMMV